MLLVWDHTWRIIAGRYVLYEFRDEVAGHKENLRALLEVIKWQQGFVARFARASRDLLLIK